jgi:hypothetical protein
MSQRLPNGYDYQAGVLHIYTAATGRLVQTILPDPAVQAMPGIPAPPADSGTTKTVINYTQILWSPDGKRLALTFFVGHWTTTNTGNTTSVDYIIVTNSAPPSYRQR